jgi:hypothetical protein
MDLRKPNLPSGRHKKYVDEFDDLKIQDDDRTYEHIFCIPSSEKKALKSLK